MPFLQTERVSAYGASILTPTMFAPPLSFCACSASILVSTAFAASLLLSVGAYGASILKPVAL